jgi:hypothetical protein
LVTLAPRLQILVAPLSSDTAFGNVTLVMEIST